MKNEIIDKIDNLIENSREELRQIIIKLVSIKSTMGKPLPGAPFGEGPRKVLDTVLQMGEKEGLYTEDYNVGVVSLALKKGQPDLGIWLHGDVVPEGGGWAFEPYKPTEYKDCIIGRGAADNKGQLAAAFTLFKILKRLGVELNYNAAIYVGSNEESGMADMKGIPSNPDAKGFVNVCTPPKLSLVPDGDWPVGYGARGMATFYFRSKSPLRSCSLTAGLDENPGLATAVFDTTVFPDVIDGCTIEKTDKTTVTAYSKPRHTSKPDPDGNMITKLTTALLENNLVCEADRSILGFLRDVSLDIHAEMFSLNVETKLMLPTILYAQKIEEKDGCPQLEIRLRYPIELTYDEIARKLTKVCDERGFEVVSGFRRHNPYLRPSDTLVVKTLTKIANEVTGDTAKPYVNGSTYAHYLPNAYIYGMNANRPPEDFAEGRGGAHNVDEAVSIDRLITAMKIYARALLALNDMDVR